MAFTNCFLSTDRAKICGVSRSALSAASSCPYVIIMPCGKQANPSSRQKSQQNSRCQVPAGIHGENEAPFSCFCNENNAADGNANNERGLDACGPTRWSHFLVHPFLLRARSPGEMKPIFVCKDPADLHVLIVIHCIFVLLTTRLGLLRRRRKSICLPVAWILLHLPCREAKHGDSQDKHHWTRQGAMCRGTGGGVNSMAAPGVAGAPCAAAECLPGCGWGTAASAGTCPLGRESCLPCAQTCNLPGP